MMILTCSTDSTLAGPGQREPDKKRTLEIQHALVDHGYSVKITGNWDTQTIEALRGIAKQNNWQSKRVPDARVLGCALQLGNKYFDPAVCSEHHNKLENKGEVDEEALEKDLCLHQSSSCSGRRNSGAVSFVQGHIQEATGQGRTRKD